METNQGKRRRTGPAAAAVCHGGGASALVPVPGAGMMAVIARRLAARRAESFQAFQDLMNPASGPVTSEEWLERCDRYRRLIAKCDHLAALLRGEEREAVPGVCVVVVDAAGCALLEAEGRAAA